jgi:hypothetical protein
MSVVDGVLGFETRDSRFETRSNLESISSSPRIPRFVLPPSAESRIPSLESRAINMGPATTIERLRIHKAPITFP